MMVVVVVLLAVAVALALGTPDPDRPRLGRERGTGPWYGSELDLVVNPDLAAQVHIDRVDIWSAFQLEWDGYRAEAAPTSTSRPDPVASPATPTRPSVTDWSSPAFPNVAGRVDSAPDDGVPDPNLVRGRVDEPCDLGDVSSSDACPSSPRSNQSSSMAVTAVDYPGTAASAEGKRRPGAQPGLSQSSSSRNKRKRTPLPGNLDLNALSQRLLDVDDPVRRDVTCTNRGLRGRDLLQCGRDIAKVILSCAVPHEQDWLRTFNYRQVGWPWGRYFDPAYGAYHVLYASQYLLQHFEAVVAAFGNVHDGPMTRLCEHLRSVSSMLYCFWWHFHRQIDKFLRPEYGTLSLTMYDRRRCNGIETCGLAMPQPGLSVLVKTVRTPKPSEPVDMVEDTDIYDSDRRI